MQGSSDTTDTGVGADPTLAVADGELSQAPTREEARRGATPTPADGGDRFARGRAVGRYLVVERLGAGGMGVVYRAFDPDLDRSVALKLVGVGAEEGGDATQDVRDRLLREAQAMARLSHPNVISVFDVGLCDVDGHAAPGPDQAALVYVAMEFVDGFTLGQWRAREDPGPVEIVEAFVQAGRGLAAAHAAGLIHRDFKPDNVMLGLDGRVRVLDFGLARALGSQAAGARERDVEDLRTTGRESLDKSMTAAGAVMGTPAYMSPEQHLGAPTDDKSDQFSFCVALFEALYGARPFPGDTMATLAYAVLKGQVVVPAEAATRVPAHLRAALLRGLSTDADQRFATMGELLAALERDPAARRRRTLWLLGGAALLVGGGTMLGGALGRPPVPGTAPAVCTGAPDELASVWNDARRQSIAGAFDATGLGYAPDTWRVASARIDALGDAWIGEHTAACRATRVTGEQSEAALDLRIGCLAEQRGQLDALLSGLGRADADGVRRAVDAVHGLPSASACADPSRLRPDAPPADPVAAAHAAAAASALPAVGAALSLGRFSEAAAALAPWIAVADAVDHAPLTARIRQAQAEVESAVGDPKRVPSHLEAAIWAATAAGDDRYAADLARELVFEAGYRLQDHAAGERWLHQARALVRRIGGDAEIAARLDNAEGAMRVSQGRYEDALLGHGRARDYWELQDDGGPDLAGVLLDIAAVDLQLGRVDEAIALDTKAVGLRREIYGEGHPQLAAALRELGNAHGFAHDWDAALPPLRDALQIQRSARGERHIQVATLLDDIGRVLRRTGDIDGAIDHHQRALAIWRERLGDHHADVGVSQLNVGYTLVAADRREDAITYFRAARQAFETAVGERHAYVVYAENVWASTLVELHRPAEARPHLERVLEIEGLEVDPTLLAETKFTLAHALWDDPASGATERGRARRLAEEAVASYRTQAERWQPQIDQIETWLRER